ncbi:hypothetical protein [Bosea sp. 685]|uniref:hypothetical protein n=1 Tax=Bosea sp. 685 TaxID=3080057 RepID=UPI002892E214|nr:hypothetical protein [Bosea sp. 685]WNJ88006.1 hypothetical protein RMR04_00210 [Bosea sp. 685]
MIDADEVSYDLVQDMVDLMTCFSARLYGRRSARNRAARASTALSMMRTFCTVVRDPACHPRLDAMAAVLARARHGGVYAKSMSAGGWSRTSSAMRSCPSRSRADERHRTKTPLHSQQQW